MPLERNTGSHGTGLSYRREIDGLRALAVLPVIFFHAGFDTFSGGFVGVDVFFVISGYLITSIILAELRRGEFSIANFYERRARRILPALFLIMLICIPFAWLWLLPSDMKKFSASLAAVSIFASNIFFGRKSAYFDPASDLQPLLHTWSLAVEEQYYVLFPLFLMFFWNFGKRWILTTLGVVFVASLALAQWAVYAQPAAAFYLLPPRGWELLIGGFAAFYLSDANRREPSKAIGEAGGWLGVGLILYSVFAYSRTTPFPGLYALVPTVGAVLVILFATQQTTVGKFVGNKAFVGIGLLSYSAYLWHQPIFAFARHRSASEPSHYEFLVLSVLSLMLAYLSWKFVETPFRKRERFKRNQIFGFSLVFSIFFFAFGLIGHFNNGFPSRYGTDLDRFFQAQNDQNPRQSECFFYTENVPSPKEYCVLGEGKVVGLLWGDSHANAIAHSLSTELSKIGLAMKSVSYFGCPPVEDVYRIDQNDQHKCYEINNQSIDYALSNRDIEYIVMLGRWPVYLEGSFFNNLEGGVESRDFISLDVVVNGVKQKNPESLRVAQVSERYRETVQRLIRSGKKVILIYPIPEVGFDVPKRLAKLKMLGLEEDSSTSYDVFLKRNQRVLEVFDSIDDHKNLIRIRPDKFFCNTEKQGRCITHLDEKIFYVDDDHLSNTGSSALAKEIVESISASRVEEADADHRR